MDEWCTITRLRRLQTVWWSLSRHGRLEAAMPAEASSSRLSSIRDSRLVTAIAYRVTTIYDARATGTGVGRPLTMRQHARYRHCCTTSPAPFLMQLTWLVSSSPCPKQVAEIRHFIILLLFRLGMTAAAHRDPFYFPDQCHLCWWDWFLHPLVQFVLFKSF